MKAIIFTAAFLFFHLQCQGAEVFIRVAKQGMHNALVHDQMQTNSTNIFRFFDLPGGVLTIQIVDQQTGLFVYNSSINLLSNQHIAVEIDLNGNFVIVQNRTILPSNWFDLSYSNGSNTTFSTISNSQGQNGESDLIAFNLFLLALEEEGFDSKKLIKAKNYVDKTAISAQQVNTIAKQFSFDSNRLDWAKYAYQNCSDKANYFLLEKTFDFHSNYLDLEKYMKSH
jgi:hypothetical protein